MGRGGFEPPKSWTTDLQSVPFGRSGISPKKMELVIGIEPTTYWLQINCSAWLSYTSIVIKLAQCNGASGRNRTTDTGIFSPLLYLLSYRSKTLATRKGLEPSTSSVTGWRTNHLYYRAINNMFCIFGGPSGTWTPDQSVMSRPLWPTELKAQMPAMFYWSEWRDSNSRPHGPKPRALPAALHPDALNISLCILQYFDVNVNNFLIIFEKSFKI